MLVLFFPGWGIPPHGTAKGTYVIFFCKSNYKMALATYLICLGKTGRSLHKQLEKEWIQQTSPNYYFKLSYFFFFYLLFRDWIFVFYEYGWLSYRYCSML